MQENLVIVESPAKAKTIERFLGKDYKVMSSYGHIRDLKKKEISINMDSLEPEYEIPEEKRKVVSELKSNAKKAKKIWLASDEDREGEAISWHLSEVLGLDVEKTNRIVFHEITRSAILDAIEHPRHINMNLANAQQARRMLDRLVGFNLSPILWRKVKPSLSAGRVQSVAVRLIVEREREIQNFVSEKYYRITATFLVDDTEIKAELDKRFSTHEEALAFLEQCKNATFTIDDIQKKPLKRTPAPPFTTSTLQQEAARKLGFTVSQTMMVAQRLYESGHITYMRTDSVNLSKLCISTAKAAITQLFGKEYSNPRNYTTRSKGAQEAHEAIRPTYMDKQEVDGTPQEKSLYNLIWKRTAATQMADAEIEKTTVVIKFNNDSLSFVSTGEIVTFDGFLKAYHESTDDENENEVMGQNIMPATMKKGMEIKRKTIISTERSTLGPQRYNEASLVHKMEELGIGRPSTYAPTISTIQQREYVVRGDKKGVTHSFCIDTLSGNNIKSKTKKEIIGNEKGKLLPTDVGIVVNDFLIVYFPTIMDYNFTAHVEEIFDKIAEGKEDWHKMLKDFYKRFEPVVEKTMKSRSEHKAGERILGEEPKTGKPVSVKIGRYGPLVQIGSADDKEKPRFAQMPKEFSLESITLEEALELFKLPRNLGQFEGKDVTIGTGRYGAYIYHNKKYVTLPKNTDPLTVTLEEATALIEDSRNVEKQRHLKSFEEDAKLEVMNGRYGPYISYDGKNYRLPKSLHEKVTELSYDECMAIVKKEQQRS